MSVFGNVKSAPKTAPSPKPATPATKGPVPPKPAPRPAAGGGQRPPQRPMTPAAPQRPSNRDPFSGIGQARMAVQANYCRAGRYLCRIDAVKGDENRKRIYFVVTEMTVIHAFDDDNGAGHKVGESVSHYMGSDSDYFLGEVKGLICGVLGADPNEIDEDDCHRIVGEEQPLAGFIVEIDNRDRVSKKNTNYTVIRYKRRWTPEDAQAVMDPETLERLGHILFPEAGAEQPAQEQVEEQPAQDQAPNDTDDLPF